MHSGTTHENVSWYINPGNYFNGTTLGMCFIEAALKNVCNFSHSWKLPLQEV